MSRPTRPTTPSTSAWTAPSPPAFGSLPFSVGRWGDVADRLRVRVVPTDRAGSVARPLGGRLSLDLVIAGDTSSSGTSSSGDRRSGDLLIRPAPWMVRAWALRPEALWRRAIGNTARCRFRRSATLPGPSAGSPTLLLSGPVWVTGLVACPGTLRRLVAPGGAAEAGPWPGPGPGTHAEAGPWPGPGTKAEAGLWPGPGRLVGADAERSLRIGIGAESSLLVAFESSGGEVLAGLTAALAAAAPDPLPPTVLTIGSPRRRLRRRPPGRHDHPDREEGGIVDS